MLIFLAALMVAGQSASKKQSSHNWVLDLKAQVVASQGSMSHFPELAT